MQKNIDFPNIFIALYFIHRQAVLVSDAWSFMDKIEMSIFENTDSVSISYDNNITRFKKESLIETTGGTSDGNNEKRYNRLKKLKITELYNHTSLEQEDINKFSSEYLIIPSSSTSTKDLILQLSYLKDFKIDFLEISFDENILFVETHIIIKLSTESFEKLDVPYGLIGNPQILKLVAENIYVPLGYSMPLLPANYFLFPQSDGSYYHTWLINEKNEYSYQKIIVRNSEPVPLANHINFTDFKTNIVKDIGIEDIKVPLILRHSTNNREINEYVKVIYSFETKGGELSSLFMRILDHTNAGIEDFIYFNSTSGDGPNAVITHYLMIDSMLQDDAMWSELKKYILPISHYEAGLMLFIPYDYEFIPSLDGALRGLDDSDSFIRKIRKDLDLENDNESELVLIDPVGNTTKWQVTKLTNGRKLSEVINITLQEYNRELIRKVVDIKRIDLSKDYEMYEKQWEKAAKSDSEELQKELESYAKDLNELIQAVSNELNRLHGLVTEFQELAQKTNNKVEEMPDEFANYINSIDNYITSVVEPRKTWITSKLNLQNTHINLLEATEQLIVSCRQRLVQINESLNENIRRMTDLQGFLLLERNNSEPMVSRLNNEVDTLNQLSNQVHETFNQRESVLNQRQEECNRIDLEINRRYNELRQYEQRVVAREQANAQRRAQQDEWEQNLNQRRAGYEREIERLNARQRDLENIEKNVIPEREKRIKELENDIADYSSRGLEEKLRSLENHISKLQQNIDDFEFKKEKIKKQKEALNQIRDKKEEIENELKVQIQELEKAKAEADEIEEKQNEIEENKRKIEEEKNRKYKLEHSNDSFIDKIKSFFGW